MRADTCAQRLHTQATALGVLKALCQKQQKPTKKACSEYQAEDKERGGKNTQHVSKQVLIGGQEGMEGSWQIGQLTLFLWLFKT